MAFWQTSENLTAEQVFFNVRLEAICLDVYVLQFYAKDLVVKIEARAEYIDSLSFVNTKQYGSVSFSCHLV